MNQQACGTWGGGGGGGGGEVENIYIIKHLLNCLIEKFKSRAQTVYMQIKRLIWVCIFYHLILIT